MKLLVLVLAVASPLAAQNWSTFLDPSRAIDWSTAGFTIPSYSTACPTAVSLATGSGAASANATSITNALASCDATHNVVNIPAGTWYVAGFGFGTQGKQVLRGAGANSTFLISTGEFGCGFFGGICMNSNDGTYNQTPDVNPPSGNRQCLWTGGLSQGSTSITLSSCGGTPPVNQTIILDQANDSTDTGGVYICDTNIAGCGYEGSSGGNNNGRFISGATHSQQQSVYVTGVTSLGGGSYTVTLATPVYFSNIRSGQAPGAWWPGFVQNDGLENLSIDGSADADETLIMYSCYQCWVKGVRFLNGARSDIFFFQSSKDVVRDSYFFGAQGSGSESYGLESEGGSSGVLIENNIFQQTTAPIVFGSGTGWVLGYNYAIYTTFAGNGSNGAYASHNAGNDMNLFEGNNFISIFADDAWGSSDQITFFRNMLRGWQTGKTAATETVSERSYARVFNIVGNVLGQPSYHTNYQQAATSGTTFAPGGSAEATSIYSLGTSDIDACNISGVLCDPKVPSTLMRWGNYDTVNATSRFDSTEASPGAVAFVNANFSSSYFLSLGHSLPASLYYSSTPSWWPSGLAWPPIGPDVTTGNVGICTGTYAGAQATSSGQCTGGSLSTAWASHVVANPAQKCYLSTLGGPPDGTGSALAFDASTCYGVAPPTFTLSTSITGTGSGTNVCTPSGSGITAGTAYSCTATAAGGSTFLSWSSSCGGTASGTTYSGNMPSSSCLVTASFQGTAATPAFSPAAGSYSTPQYVSISSSTPGATVYYTVDGSTPTTASAIYSVPLYVYSTQALKALAVASGWTNSAVGSAAYTIAAQKTRFSLMRASTSQVPVPFPSDDRMLPSSGVKITNIEATRGTYTWTSYDAWVTSANAHGAKIQFTYTGRPNWMTGLGSSTDGPPTDLNTTAACQNVLTGTTTTDCSMKEFTTAHMMHITGLSSQPVAPVACPNLDELEAGNEVDTASGSSNGVGWSGTAPQFAKMSDDIAEIKAKWCTSATKMQLGSVSAVVGSNVGSNPQYEIYMAALLALIPQADQGLYQGVSFHAYPGRDNVIPVPPPSGLVSYSDPACTSGNTPNNSCRNSIATQVTTLQTGALNQAANVSWSKHFPISSTEGGFNKVLNLNGDNNFGIAYVSEYIPLLAAQAPVTVEMYLGLDSPCGSSNWGCYWLSGNNSTVTFTNSSAVISGTNTFTAGQIVQFITSGTLPSNFRAATNYYVSSTGLSGSQFELAATHGGTPIVASGVGSGTITAQGASLWYPSFTATTGWLNSATSIGTCTTSSITGGTKWTCPLNGGTSEIDFCAVQNPATCTGPTSFTQQQDINGVITPISGTVTLNSTASLLFNGGSATAPTFSPVAGSYGASQSVAISTIAGPVICYNTTGSPATNGTTGCTTGTLYTGLVTVASSETLYAVAGGTGFADSTVASAAYVINGAAATPTFSPAAGSYGPAQSVTISTSTGGATICYTQDGSTPTANGSGSCTHGATYSGAITVPTSQTIKAVASKPTFTDSSVGSAAYVINGAAAIPTFSPVAGTYSSTQFVTLASSTAGATLCYTTDGSTPTANGAGTCTHGTTYSTAISVSSTQTVKAIASKSSWSDSSVSSALYTILSPPTPPVVISGTVKFSGTVGIQ